MFSEWATHPPDPLRYISRQKHARELNALGTAFHKQRVMRPPQDSQLMTNVKFAQRRSQLVSFGRRDDGVFFAMQD